MDIPEIEKQSTSSIKKFQEEKLRKQLQYNYQHSRFYERLFKKRGLHPNQIQTIEDLQLLPPTTKGQLQEYNEDFICVDRRKIVDYITTSGTAGDPVTFALTDNDLERLAYNEAISFAGAGLDENDTLLLTTTIDKRFMAGLAYFLGARKLNSGVIRVGAGVPELQWDSINRFSPTTIVAVPSFILKLIDYAEKNHIDHRASSIHKAICIGESIRKTDFSLTTLAAKIKEKWDIDLYSTYASTEMGTAFTECCQMKGGHHHPELIIVEFLDGDNNPVKDGEAGEVTITTLGVEGMPLVRFKTGDILYHYNDTCGCGRNTMRLGPVIGRRSQMIKFKGTTLFPAVIYDILNEVDLIENYVLEVYTNDIGTDEVLIHVGCSFAPEDFEKTLKDRFKANLRVTPEIRFYDVETVHKMQFPPSSRKAIKFIDNRR